MPRVSQAGITIGFLGTGEMEADAAIGLIEQYINESVKPDESVKFVFPVTESEFSDTLALLATMARRSSITYEAITNPEDKSRRPFQEAIDGAAHTHVVTDIWTQMEQILVDASKSVLFVLWDEKRDQELLGICGRFNDAEIDVLDLTNGLAPLVDQEGRVLQEEEEKEEEPEEPEEETEEPEEDEPEAVMVYHRAQLMKMPHSDVKAIAVGMGLPPRKAREHMITAILEAQGTPETVTAGPAESQAVAALTVDSDATTDFLNGLGDILDNFGTRFMTGLDEWLTKFSTAAEGFAFNVEPEKPMEDEPEPAARRRLVRG
jgi:hypothetical protein